MVHDEYYRKYSHIPVLTYSQAFYDSDSFNEAMAQDHPFAKAYKHSSVFFNTQAAVIAVLIVLLIAQVLFWIMTIAAYVPIFKEYLRKNKNNKVL